MKSNGLLSVVTFSEVRKEILFLLEDGPKELSDFKSDLRLTSPEIIPNIRKMQNKHMIIRINNKYYLTNIGFALVKSYKKLVNIVNVIEKNENYWSEHKTELIPQVFFDRIYELCNYEIIINKNENVNEAHEMLLENINTSELIQGIFCTFHPSYFDMLLKKATNNIPINLIFAPNIHEHIKKNYEKELNRLLECERVHIFIMSNDAKFTCFITDKFFSLSLPFNNGMFDNMESIISYDKSAISWGISLFNYYNNLSIEV